MIEIRRITMKTALHVLLIYLILSSLSFDQKAYAWPSAVSLQTDSVIEDRFVRLKHIFSGITANKEHILAPMPTDGTPYVLNYQELQKVADAFDLYWPDSEKRTSLTLKSGLIEINPQQIKKILDKSALSKKIKGDFSLALSHGTERLFVPKNQALSYKVRKAQYDVLSENFSVTLDVLDKQDNVIKSHEIKGTAQKMVDIPVLSKRMKNGDVIRKNHIQYVKVPKRGLESDIILDTEDLVGMTARKSISSETPIKDSDVIPPLLVERNDMVTVQMKAGPILITTKARALDMGSKGDIIQIMNLDSRKILEGVVIGPQVVSVSNSNYHQG